LRCPECGSTMRKIKKGKGIVYECTNSNCPIIELRRHGHYLYPKIEIVKDSVMEAKENDIRKLTQQS